MKAIKEFQGVPNGEIYPVTYAPGDEVPPELHATARYFDAMADAPPRNEAGLRTDGPTVADYVAAGYQAANYPPEDYASRSTAEEIAGAIAAQQPTEAADPAAAASEVVAERSAPENEDQADPAKLTIPEIKAKLDELKIEHKSGMSKAELLALLPKD